MHSCVYTGVAPPSKSMDAALVVAMGSFPSPYHLVLLNTRFRAPQQRLFFSRARLYFDRIELTGWQLPEPFEEVIHLSDVVQIEWDPQMGDRDKHDVNVVFKFSDGRTLPLVLDQHASWRHTLEHRLSWQPRRAAA